MEPPSPWLKHPLHPQRITPHPQASFVEYLRWMRTRSPDGNSTVDSGTLLELFKNLENGDFSESLERLTRRTKKLSHEWFTVKCPWRIRVGGTKGPESMLLPATDALGMPYIPSSTLRGIAREVARQSAEVTEEELKKIFGDIDPEPSQMAQVVFLDAYPLPKNHERGGVEPDMANSIWRWEKGELQSYPPNPNNFLSLEKPTFIIGLRKTRNCSGKIFGQVKVWLIQGLTTGIGGRVNSGYGTLFATGNRSKEIIKRFRKSSPLAKLILKVPFELEGQLIHGSQTFKGWRSTGTIWKPPGQAKSEVRAVSFRCMLRYWFRVFALGKYSGEQTQTLEQEIFGGIEPEPSTGLFRLEVINGKVENEVTKSSPGLMSGNLTLRQNAQFGQLEASQQQALISLLKSLTWLTFHLGGVGQGARRPCYQRRAGNPPWRGSSLIPDPEGTRNFWDLPRTLERFKKRFQKHWQTFYDCLEQFSGLEGVQLNRPHPRQEGTEVADSNCKILACQGEFRGNKPFALSILHHPEFKLRNGSQYNPILCGGVSPPKPSPVWIRVLDYIEGIDIQVVTVFGANSEIRADFLKKLKQESSGFVELFPLNRG